MNTRVSKGTRRYVTHQEVSWKLQWASYLRPKLAVEWCTLCRRVSGSDMPIASRGY